MENGYIYKTTNLINNKIYIGQKKGNFNKNYYGSGKIINKAIKKYGIENFKVELLYECKNKIELDKKEKYYIEIYNSLTKYNNYNIANGGHGDNGIKGKTYEEYFGEEKSKILKEKHSKLSLGIKNPMHNHRYNNETLEKLSKWQKGKSYIEKYGEEKAKEILEKKKKSMIGKKHTQKTKDMMRKSQLEYYKNNPNRQKGENNGNYGKKHPGLNKGKKHSEETIEKIKIKAKNRKRRSHSEESKLKIKLALKGKKHNMTEKGANAIRESNRRRTKNNQ